MPRKFHLLLLLGFLFVLGNNAAVLPLPGANKLGLGVDMLTGETTFIPVHNITP